MRLSSFFRSKLFSIIRQIFSSIEINENILIYWLSEIDFNYYKSNAID